jgi:N-acetylmuramoyl-L-alanine amidase
MERSSGAAVKALRYVIMIALCSFLSVGFAGVSPFSMPIDTLILDPGHGGHDPGAVAGDLQEKDIVLAVTQKLADYLNQWFPDLTLVLTRSDDRFLSLEDRVAIAAEQPLGVGSSALMVSVHANASHSSEASGVEILIKPTDHPVTFLSYPSPDWALFRYANFTSGELNQQLNRENLLLATLINDRLMQHLPIVRNRGIKEQDVFILSESTYASVLVEIGFISNEQERKDLSNSTYQSTIARAIAEGISDYLNLY